MHRKILKISRRNQSVSRYRARSQAFNKEEFGYPSLNPENEMQPHNCLAKRPGAAQSDTWIQDDSTDGALPTVIEPDAEDGTQSSGDLEWLKPEPPIHDAVFFGLIPECASLRLIDLETGQPICVCSSLGDVPETARALGLHRYAVKVVA